MWPAQLSKFALLASQILAPSHSLQSPSTCLSTSTTIEHLVDCFHPFTVPERKYPNYSSYNAAQPNATQRQAWSDAITAVLNVDGNCSSIPIHPSINTIISIVSFTESSGTAFCVLYESSIESGHYAKGWGLFVVPELRADVSRSVHFSAPHPGWPGGDGDTPQQAAALLKATGAKSLLVSGRRRTASTLPSDCVSSIPGAKPYYMTDPAHSVREPSFDANLAIIGWQNENGGCPATSCAFIQLHGKARTTCPSEQVFLSSGLGNSNASIAWYTNDVDRPIKRLKTQLLRSFPGWNISLPSDDNCILTATKNVVGRYLNNVDLSHVCVQGATAQGASGKFIHIEQAVVSLEPANLGPWAAALRETFGTT
ncbi:hypothetical protein K443DRAFT_680414 [Laccaria amethystina LaAM-08-1]|uniref:Uncharacterized protein n=1 Tax=Laccaria amethystina LaAM-08-1 TaxID=1095629 RepID=A0A0C9XMR6_9AGAR|nr:hypothetical protein K443DRAFT_680414 [Laccaria amethystina LaAM-08-1]